MGDSNNNLESIFGLLDIPFRDPSWYTSVAIDTQGMTQRRVSECITGDTRLSGIIAGGFWAQQSAQDIPITRIHVTSRLLKHARKIGVRNAFELFSSPLSDLVKPSTRDLYMLVGAACLPPKGSMIRWLSFGEALHQLLPRVVIQNAQNDISALSFRHSNQRTLRRYGISSIGRLLFTQPEFLTQQRGVGSSTIGEIALTMLKGISTPPHGFANELASLGAAPFAEWKQIERRINDPEVISNVAKLIRSELTAHSTMSSTIDASRIRWANELQLADIGMKTGTILKVLAVMSSSP